MRVKIKMICFGMNVKLGLLRQERILKVTEDRVLREIFDLEQREITGIGEKLHNYL
jgi:hypothetical protein